MSEWFWKKLNWYVSWMTYVAIFVLVLFIGHTEIKDLDLWLHLSVGKYITETHHVPRYDIFSCTVFSKAWINHEWLFQVAVYNIYRLFSADGLVTSQAIIVGIIFLLLFGMGRAKTLGHLPLIFLLLITTLVYEYRPMLRPDLISLLLLVVSLIFVRFCLSYRYIHWIFFVLQMLWANIHGFFILGPVVLAIFILGEWFKRRQLLPFHWNEMGRLQDAEYRRLKASFVFMIGASLCNPCFIMGVIYPVTVFLSFGGKADVFFESITELQKPFIGAAIFDFHTFPAFKLSILASLTSMILNYRRINISLLMLWLISLCSGLSAVRNMIYFAVVAYVVIVDNLSRVDMVRYLPALSSGKRREILSLVTKVFLMGWIVLRMEGMLLQGYYDFDRNERKSEYGGVTLRNYPNKAADFIVQNQIKGNLFNDFNSGAYLLGRAYPNIRVFIDGRTELYGADFFRQYRKALKGDVVLFDHMIDQYTVTAIFLNGISLMASQELYQHLYPNPHWKLVYFDYDGAIFLRDLPRYQKIIKKYQIDLANWQIPSVDLMAYGLVHVVPYQHVDRAEALYRFGFFDKAMAEAQEAIRIKPDYAEAYKILGKIYLKQKQYEHALEKFRQAKVLDAGDMETRYYLADVLQNLGELDLAEEQCQRVLESSSKNRKGLFLLSLIYAKQSKENESIQVLQQALNVIDENQDKIEEMTAIADVFVSQGKTDVAQAVSLFIEQATSSQKVQTP